MKVIRLAVNWAILFLSPIWSFFFLMYHLKKDWDKSTNQNIYKNGDKWSWQ